MHARLTLAQRWGTVASMLASAAIVVLASTQSVTAQTPASALPSARPGSYSDMRATAPNSNGADSKLVVPATPAQAVRGAPTQGASVVASALEITSADKITVKIQGQPELSGDYRIADDQTISIPVLGRVSVAHLDAAGLEKVLAERLSRLMGREAYVTVEVADYRPVFVSGYVSRPGTAPWKPGMTVLQAVTVSGGTFRGANSNGIDGGINNKAQRAIDDQKRVLATIARLSAERDGADHIELPPRLIALVGRKEAQDLIDAQLTSFLSRKNATDAQAAGLERAISLAKEEQEYIRAQRQRLQDQLKFRRTQYVRLKALYDKQFLRIDRLTDEEVKISELEEKIASLGVAISKSDSTLVGLQRDLSNLKQDRRAIIDVDLLKLERDSAQLELEIEAAGPVTRTITRPLADADGVKKEVIVYEIVRQEGPTPKTMMADRNTLLKPGDMLVVSVQ